MQSRGSQKHIVMLVIAVFLLGGGLLLLSSILDRSMGKTEEVNVHTTSAPVEHETSLLNIQDASGEEESVMEATAEGTIDKNQQVIDGEEEIEDAPLQFEGEVLAGGSAPLLVFNQADYERALSDKKVVVLYFYANWCPYCMAEFPKMQAVFNGLENSDIVGFRVNYKDNETSTEEEQLAREFGVAYQHTKIILKNGERVLKSPETWDQARYEVELANALQ